MEKTHIMSVQLIKPSLWGKKLISLVAVFTFLFSFSLNVGECIFQQKRQ